MNATSPQPTEQRLREKRVEMILQQLEELPTLPGVALRVLDATRDDASSLDEVVRLIQSDQSLTASILKLVHRADLGVRGDVNSVERAVLLLGFEAVRSAVLSVTVFQTFPSIEQKQGAHFRRDEFWKHCIAVACCAELLADALKKTWGKDSGIEPSEAFVCGLLHDLGKVALDAALPKSFDRVVEAADLLRGNIADLERTVIGLDHMVVGKRLAERWKLPPAARDCIWLHGQLPQALPTSVKSPRLVNLISLADLLVREQHLGYSGNYLFPISRQVLIEAVGLTAEQVSGAMDLLVRQIEPRAAALGLGHSSSGELYLSALSQANRELGRVSAQLASKNRRLATRAKYFDALSRFQGELRPDASPQGVLKAVGETAVGVLDVTSCAAFSLSPAQDFAEVLLFDATGEVFESTLVDCTQRPPKPAEGDGPVLAAGDDMEWLLAAISPRLAQDQRFWMCLEADGACVGGVVWGGMNGEGQRLSTQVQELTALAAGWSLALRTAQIREEARILAEQLADANRRLQSAQSEILRSKTMVTVGEMAGGAAHEMNNPLAVISGRSQLLAAQLEDPKLKGAANLIFEQSQRLSDIITEMMLFAKPVPPAIVELGLAELVERALAEAKGRTDPADRSFEVSLSDVPQLAVDAGQITAALVEVIDNAVHATDPKSGRISLTGAFDPYSLRVVLTVADNGCGMDEHTLKCAFDPFFSSRKAGRRRGMGLAKALRWLEASGGSMRLESRPDQGTRAMLLLPVAAPARQSAPESARKAAGP